MITGIDEDFLREVLREHLTPSDHIKTPERLFGRQKALQQISRAFNSTGRHIFIYGDRGVGKSSLALTSAYLVQNSAEEPVYITCGTGQTFGELIFAAANAALPPEERLETPGKGSEITLPMSMGARKPGERPRANYGIPRSLTDAVELLRYISSRRSGRTVVIFDEFERIKNDFDKAQFAELVKNLPVFDKEISLILSGIGSSVDEMMGAHQSVSRRLETIPVNKINHDELWKIIAVPAAKLGVTVEQDLLIRASILSDGFPHYVHLLAESIFWAMHDDDVSITSPTAGHFRQAVKGTLERTEAVHKSAWYKATHKTTATRDYEAALFSLADRSDTRSQVVDIYERSYRRIGSIMAGADGSILDKDKFNQRLLRLRDDSHGNVVIGHGSGWFSFRENVFRGYVRLEAENRNIALGGLD